MLPIGLLLMLEYSRSLSASSFVYFSFWVSSNKRCINSFFSAIDWQSSMHGGLAFLPETTTALNVLHAWGSWHAEVESADVEADAGTSSCKEGFISTSRGFSSQTDCDLGQGRGSMVLMEVTRVDLERSIKISSRRLVNMGRAFRSCSCCILMVCLTVLATSSSMSCPLKHIKWWLRWRSIFLAAKPLQSWDYRRSLCSTQTAPRF